MNYLLGLYEKAMPGSLDMEQKLIAAKNGGYDFMELSVDESDEKLSRLLWSGDERKRIVELMYKTGVPIGSICLSGHRKYPLGHPDPAVRARSLEIMEGAVGLARDLGIRLIQLAGYDVYYEKGSEQTRGFFAENLQKCVSMASAHGVVLAFETMETDFMNTVEKAMYWVEKIRSPYLQVYPDVGNVTNAALAEGRDPIEDMKKGAGHIAAVHLKQTLPGVFREVPYENGHVDFAAMAEVSRGLGARRFLAEFWYDGREYQATLAQNARFLRSFLNETFNA